MKDSKLKILGSKVFLRHILHEDFEEMLELFQSSREFYQGLINAPTDAESFRIYADRNLAEENECFVICQNIDNKIVGAINLTQIFRKSFQNAYLGYLLGVNFTGKGFYVRGS